ncbi:alpha-N-arabinofuranosidase [Caulobacter sp. S45]|uniref:alpha-N-arabinofuranosidase n=1 Tax=Caulobacter sp. S45 TaxID=1641861 RepID=UPI00131C4A96|nr:alpha-L-arabinofuranosidase C-terminal domain-containing protein [Caulobacter sp. S45]
MNARMLRPWAAFAAIVTLGAPGVSGPASAAPTIAAPTQASVVVRLDQPGPTIDRHVYGQFAEHLGTGIYGGVWVGENSPIPNTRGYRNDVLAALRELHVPVIRWPGGCFADEYNWREGIGPRDKRPVRVNTNWGGVEEPNSFGTNEFMTFTELVGADAYVAGDIGSTPPRDLAEWVEYITSPTRSTLAQERRTNGREQPWKLPYLGVGNEVWGCGGHMRPEYAADLFRRYQTFVKVPAGEKLMKIASGPNVDDYNFTEVMMREAAQYMGGLSLHYYTVPTGVWAKKGSPVDFGEDQWISTLSRALHMDELITRHSAIMDKYDPKKRVALVVDEWGVWTDVDPGTNPGFLRQQNSLRDALVAASTLNIFHAHADRVRMANIAQMVNVLQSMILTDGPKMVLTPSYYVFDMYKGFQDATAYPVQVKTSDYSYAGFTVPEVQASAAKGADGVVHVALVNLDPHRSADVAVALQGASLKTVAGRVLTGPAINSINTFEHPGLVKPVVFAGAKLEGGALKAVLPPKSVVVLDLR